MTLSCRDHDIEVTELRDTIPGIGKNPLRYCVQEIVTKLLGLYSRQGKDV
jgi:hypothetical protein